MRFTRSPRAIGHTITEATLGDDSPAHPWAETHNPANQWLRNTLERTRFQATVHDAGQWARWYVWAGLTPDLTEADMWTQWRRFRQAGDKGTAEAVRLGWHNHRGPAVNLLDGKPIQANRSDLP